MAARTGRWAGKSKLPGISVGVAHRYEKGGFTGTVGNPMPEGTLSVVVLCSRGRGRLQVDDDGGAAGSEIYARLVLKIMCLDSSYHSYRCVAIFCASLT